MDKSTARHEGFLYPEAISRVQKHLERAPEDWSHMSAIAGTGPIADFERMFARACGGRHAIALSNCTSALFVALIAAGVKQGDEVILPAYTWGQTLAPVLLTGATPVFADISARSVTVDPDSVARLLSEKTKAIIGVHLCGIPADVNSLAKIARRAKVCLIYDCAQGFGSSVGGKGIGAYGDYVAFSFGRSKLLSIGEGGALVCNSRSLYERAIGASQHPLRMHRDIDDAEMRSSIDGVVMNFRMHPLIASLGIGQLEGFANSCIGSAMQSKYGEIMRIIKSMRLARRFPRVPRGVRPSGVAIPLILEEDCELLYIMRRLKKGGLEARKGGLAQPLHLTSTIRNHRMLSDMNTHTPSIERHATHEPGSCPNSEERCRLPQLFVSLSRSAT